MTLKSIKFVSTYQFDFKQLSEENYRLMKHAKSPITNKRENYSLLHAGVLFIGLFNHTA